MKFVFLLAFALMLSACNPATNTETGIPATAPNVIDVSQTGSKPLNSETIARLGDICGPNSGKICADGLSCQFEGLNQTEGRCLTAVVNPDLECEETRDPVCGLIGNNKNGFLNECYAQRFGAVVVSKGFCKPDPTIIGNCEARAYSLGNCQNSFAGARFNEGTGNCEAVTLVGCGADIPFESVEACENACR